MLFRSVQLAEEGQRAGADFARAVGLVAKERRMVVAAKGDIELLFLEGLPVVSNLKKITIGADAAKQLTSDHAAEANAIISYNAAIKLAGEVADYATREILEGILKDEDAHIDKIEELQDQISQMGAAIFLTTQVG